MKMHSANARRRTRAGIAAVVAISAGIALVGCSQGPEEREEGDPVTLRIAWSGSDDRNVRTQEALDLYMERNEHVTIEVEYTTTTNFWDRLTTQVAAGDAPDVIQMSGQTLAQFASNDILLDMEQFSPDPISLEGWEEAPLEAVTFEDTLYGIPPALDGHALIYDATKFEELGIDVPQVDWTWSEFADLAREITEKAGGDYYGTEDGGAQYEVLQSWVNQRDKKLFEDGELGFDREDVIDLWEFWADLREEGVAVPPALQTEQGTSPENSGVVQKYSAMDFAVSSLYTNYVGLTNDDVGINTFPFAEDGTPGQVWRAGFGWSITKSSEAPEEAARLIDFLVNDSDAGAILQTTRGVPANPAIREEVRRIVDVPNKQSFDYLQTLLDNDAQITPLQPIGFPDFRDLYERLYYEVAFGQKSLEDGVDELMSQAPNLIG